MSRTIKRPYRGSRAFDATCRCHGSCPYCRSNRLHSTIKREMETDEPKLSKADLDQIQKAVRDEQDLYGDMTWASDLSDKDLSDVRLAIEVLDEPTVSTIDDDLIY